MSWWRRRPGASRGALVVAALAGAVSLTGSMAAAPAQAASGVRQMEWHVDAMRLPDAWKISEGKGITVAVIDGGVDSSLPDLQGQVVASHDFSPKVKLSYTSDDGQHGTGMASLIAGTGRAYGGGGAIGVAPQAKILSLRVADNLNAADQGANEAVVLPQLAQAIRYAADSPARVVNISIAVDTAPAVLKNAVAYALSKGKLIFAGAGNSRQSGDPVQYPAGLPGVVGVGALDKNGNSTSESETGPQVALSAPGTDMYYACAGPTGYCVAHGTSDSTAVVSGAAALVWAKHPSWTGDQVLRVLINTALGPQDGAKRNDDVGYGLVRPRIALEQPGDPGPADVSPLVPASAATASPTPATSASPAPKPSASTAGAQASASGGGSDLPWIGVGVVVVVVAVAGGVVLARRRAR
ncbi:type VII secretion-associated serine protease mycosin [Streptomyces sp. SL13]|uniref:Type VII secretion-associated serine protease mycosin n=1 Tax=Streptantibioticus silvisoli TaxID=2705255 RepID=A0AA90KIB6_9ACTN|nr:type VII secretion-associated serine protease mycosin [Streptantibioticus silvisoli]MDI5972885.1 type VII secretion-associated serine protease mycosin [Streptantibioticus silvisoli]